jgi:hypothetical protein
MIIMMSLLIVSQQMEQNINQKILVEEFYQIKTNIDLIIVGEILRGDRIVNTKFKVIKLKKKEYMNFILYFLD